MSSKASRQNRFYEENLIRIIAEQSIRAEHLSFSQSCHSVAEAASAVGVQPDDFVKNICLVDADNRLIVAIVKGEDRLDLNQVADSLGLDRKPRLATPDEILERTGFPCGGTPSFGFEALFVMDERCFERELVYTGGGSEQALVCAGPHELLRANQGLVASLRKT